MRWSKLFIPTLRDAPADAEAASHALLVRGGFIRQLHAGRHPKRLAPRSDLTTQPHQESKRVEPKYLDPVFLDTPALALDQIRLLQSKQVYLQALHCSLARPRAVRKQA